MEILALSLLKTLASTCLRLYLGYLFAADGIQSDRKDLGYSIPAWFMNPDRQATAFHAYGTSVKGDEFESLEDARQQAVEQMVSLIRRSHQRIISEEIRYDASSVKQRRLVDLFLRGDSLHAFVLNTAVVDRKKIVKVKKADPDLRAFVRLRLETEDYLAHQERILRELRIRLTHQKSEDIMAELDAEMQEPPLTHPMQDLATPPGSPGATAAPLAPPAPAADTRPPALPAPTSVFDSLQSELENIQ